MMSVVSDRDKASQAHGDGRSEPLMSLDAHGPHFPRPRSLPHGFEHAPKLAEENEKKTDLIVERHDCIQNIFATILEILETKDTAFAAPIDQGGEHLDVDVATQIVNQTFHHIKYHYLDTIALCDTRVLFPTNPSEWWYLRFRQDYQITLFVDQFGHLDNSIIIPALGSGTVCLKHLPTFPRPTRLTKLIAEFQALLQLEDQLQALESGTKDDDVRGQLTKSAAKRPNRLLSQLHCDGGETFDTAHQGDASSSIRTFNK